MKVKSNKMKANQGITLIALIITIIIMLILVGVSIQLVINSGLFETAGQTVGEMQNAIGKEQEIASGGVNVDEKYYDSIDEYINGEEEYVGLTITTETEGVTYTDKDGNTKELTEEVQDGDIVIYGDYEYHYNQTFARNPRFIGWKDDSELEGWGVRVLDNTKSQYGELCGSIFGKPLKNVDCLFGAGSSAMTYCFNLKVSPKIPASVASMGGTFQYCNNLLTAPVIPSNVINMSYAFFCCSNLEGIITINANPTEYYNWIGSNVAVVLKGKSTMLGTLAEGHSNITITD